MRRYPYLRGLDDCGCCEGRSIKTPAAVYNRPGLRAIAYRVGTYSDFRDTMLTSISSEPNLLKLTTRDGDDPSISVLDSWAVIADILTFYQERIANESYLRTATERRSVLELARMIGYELNPGVAASTYLAFDLEEASGSPEKVTIDKGLKVQSTPGQDEKPQIFETIEKIEARAEWNAMRPRQTKMMLPAEKPNTPLYFRGLNTNLRKGDLLLIVGREREEDPTSNIRQVCRITDVIMEPESGRTRVQHSVISTSSPFPRKGSRVYALRTRAYFFGHNDTPSDNPGDDAGRPGVRNPENGAPVPVEGSDSTFKMSLDAVYSQIVSRSWLILIKSDSTFEVFQVNDVGEQTLNGNSIVSKATTLVIEGINAAVFDLKTTTIYAQSEELELAETPLNRPLSINEENEAVLNEIVLDKAIDGLKKGMKVAITGKRMRAKIGRDSAIMRSLKDPEVQRTLEPGEKLIFIRPPIETDKGVSWDLMDATGFEGSVTISGSEAVFSPSLKDDIDVSEIAELNDVGLDDRLTRLILVKPLKNFYDRTTVKISANLAQATHGETVHEALGSGDGRTLLHRFTLKGSPLTYVSAPTAQGSEPELEVRVNDILWHEVPTLYGHSRDKQVYEILIGDDGRTTVLFDSRLPTGQENVRARYRKGIGSEGLVKAGKLNILLSRPLGVRGVANPLPADGGQDRESLQDARQSTPLKVMTLDRVVSLKDYEDFARAFSGIAKAMATWIWEDEKRKILVTVAGPGGNEIDASSPTIDNLLASMQKHGDPWVPLSIKPYKRATFRVEAQLKIDPDEIPEKVISRARQRLKDDFSFQAREFGQPVFQSEIVAALHRVSGVVAAKIHALYRTDTKETNKETLGDILEAAAIQPAAGADGSGATLLILEDADLGVMT